MSEPLRASSQRVQEFLSGKGYDFTVRELASSTRTAQEAADSVGCSIAQIAKSIIFRNKADNTPVLVVASGANRVNTRKIEQAAGIKLGKADADFVRAEIGYAIGGVPPIAHIQKVTTFLDPDLQQHEVIWAAAGTPNSLFELKPADLALLTEGQWIDIAE